MGASTLKRVAPGWLARSIADARAMSHKERIWMDLVRKNWVRDEEQTR